MRPVRYITDEEENFRMEPMKGLEGVSFIKRDPVEPEPVGTLVAMVFRITGYQQDCDGSLMAKLEKVDSEGRGTGLTINNILLYPECSWVVDDPDLCKDKP